MEQLPQGLRPGGRFAQWRRVAPRYVVVDVDGTLLGHGHQPTLPAVEAAHACRAAGLHLGLATGRMPAAVAELATLLEADGPHVVHNGAEVWADGRLLAAWPLPADAAARMRELCARLGLYAEFYLGDGYWVTDRRGIAARHWGLLRKDPDGEVADLDPAVPVLKATVILFGEDPAAVMAALGEAGLNCGIAHAPALPEASFLNVTHPEADKGRALAVAAAHAGAAMDEVVAIGDGLNDLSMLAVAGTAVAMGQAPDEVREAAHVIVPEFDADGVAHALRAVAAWVRQPGRVSRPRSSRS